MSYKKDYVLGGYILKLTDDSNIIFDEAINAGYHNIPETAACTCIYISVYDNLTDSKVCEYIKDFHRFVDGRTIDRYMQKFLSIPESRYLLMGVDYLGGLCDKGIQLETDTECKEYIHFLNTKPVSAITYDEFSKLKIKYQDKYSYVRFHSLVEQVSEDIIQTVCHLLRTRTMQTQALRWYCRGLDIDKAVTKVQVDDYMIQSLAQRNIVAV